MRTWGSPNELIKLYLDCRAVPILCVLYQENHQKRDDRRASIDNELPSVAEFKNRTVIDQIKTTAQAMANTLALPEIWDICLAKRSNKFNFLFITSS